MSKFRTKPTLLTLAVLLGMAACQATAPLPQRTFSVDPDDLESPTPSPILLPANPQPVNSPLPSLTPPPGATPNPTVTANVSPVPVPVPTPFVNPTPPPSWVTLTLQATAAGYANLIGEVRMLEAQGRVSNVALLPDYRVQLSASEDVVADLRAMAR